MYIIQHAYNIYIYVTGIKCNQGFHVIPKI